MQKKEIDISVQVMNDQGKVFRVNSAAPLNNVLPQILEKVIPDSQQRPLLVDCKFLVARQLTSAELDLIDSSESTGLGLENGDYLIIVPYLPSTGISLRIMNARTGKLIKSFDQDTVLVGRWDPDANINPDLDLTPLMPVERQTKISRRQLFFERQDNQWFVKLHPEVRTQVFLDTQILEKSTYYPVQDGVSIGFGGKPTNPEARVICHLMND